MQLPVRFRIFAACYVTYVSIETWRAKTITSTYLAKAATSKKIKHYQKMLVNNMAQSSISLNHIQQKTDLLTIAVIRKRRRWTANMAVAWVASSGEHFCCFLPSFFFFLFSFSLREKYSRDILNAILCHKYHPNHSNRAIYCERRHHLEIWARTRYFLFIFLPTSALGKRARLLGTDLISERGIRTIKDKNMEQDSPFLQFVGFMRFV